MRDREEVGECDTKGGSDKGRERERERGIGGDRKRERYREKRGS